MILKSIFYLNSTRRLRQVKTKPTILASLPSRASVLSNTVITVGLVGIGDFLAQVNTILETKFICYIGLSESRPCKTVRLPIIFK